jgi:hypothetical protein
MSPNTLVRWVAALVCVLGIWGCAKKAPAPRPTKTAADYKAEADKQITEQNASQELDKLEQSINEEANQP